IVRRLDKSPWCISVCSKAFERALCCAMCQPQRNVGRTWREFFRDPSKWCDNRSSKSSPTDPDFYHELTQEPLWMHSPDTPSWVANELIRRRLCKEKKRNVVPGSSIWACCKTKDLSLGTHIHHKLQKRGLSEKKYSDALVTMYAKCGELQKAQALLDLHHSSSIVPWTALIAGYARQGKGQDALNSFEQMQRAGIPPNAVTFACTLKACAVAGAVDKGKQIHDEILRQGLLEHDIVLGNVLVDMYAKCGALPQAQSVLEKLPSRNIVAWSALIAGYAQNGQGQQALECSEQMQHEGICPNAVTYVCILKACAMIKAIDKGKQIHDKILRQGLLERDLLLGNALVDMYAKCGTLPQAHAVLEKLPLRDVISWSALIAGYAKNGQGQKALECFEKMQREGILPNGVTFFYLLNMCNKYSRNHPKDPLFC
ncbi:hypothetical protein GOP47_0027978, partial [Adiantum capillus-veneris]